MKHTSKRLSSIVLAGALTFSQFIPSFGGGSAQAVNFTDTNGHWAQSSINRFSYLGIIKGDENGKFNPNNNLTRAEFATIFANLLGLTQKSTNIYSDLKGNEWYADAILKCTKAGIMQGDDRNNCNAKAYITRQEAITVFARVLNAEQSGFNSLSKYSDANEIASWAKSAMASLVDLDIISGVDNNKLAPTQNINRASAIKMLDNAIAAYIQNGTSFVGNDTRKFIIVNALSSAQVDISGYAQGLIITQNTNADIKVNSGKIDYIYANSDVDLDINDCQVKDVQLNDFVNLDVSKNTTLKRLDVNYKSNIKNNGVIEYAAINANDVIIDGTAPKQIHVANGIEKPKNSKGQNVVSSGGSSSGSGGSSGGSSSSGSGGSSGGSSSSGSGGSSSIKNVYNATDFKNILSSNVDKLSINLVDGDYSDLTSKNVLNFYGSKLTIDFNSLKESYAHININAPNATEIVLNDNALGSQGAVFDAITINAPNADVVSNIKFNVANIIAVKDGTFVSNDNISKINLRQGAVDVKSSAGNVDVNIPSDATGKTAVKGTVNNLTINSLANYVDVSADANNIKVNPRQNDNSYLILSGNAKSLDILEDAKIEINERITIDNITISPDAINSSISGNGELITIDLGDIEIDINITILELKNIEVQGLNKKAKVGERVNFDNAKIIAHYNNVITNESKTKEFMVNDLLNNDNFYAEITSVPAGKTNNNNLVYDEGEGTYQLTFTYKSKTAIADVEVTSDEQPAEVTEISVKDFNTTAKVNESVNVDNAKLVVKHSNGKSDELVIKDNSDIDVKITSVPAGKTNNNNLVYDEGEGIYQLTFTYKSKTAIADVEVTSDEQPAEVTEISVKDFNTTAKVNESVNVDNAKLVVKHSNGKSDELVIKDNSNIGVKITSVPAGKTNNNNLVYDEGEGTYQLTFTYKSKTAIVDVEVTSDEQPALSVTGIKPTALIDDRLDLSNAKLIVNNNGEPKELTVKNNPDIEVKFKTVANPDQPESDYNEGNLGKVLRFGWGSGHYEVSFTYQGQEVIVPVEVFEVTSIEVIDYTDPVLVDSDFRYDNAKFVVTYFDYTTQSHKTEKRYLRDLQYHDFSVNIGYVPNLANNWDIVFNEGAGTYELGFEYKGCQDSISVNAIGQPFTSSITGIKVEGLPLKVQVNDNVNFDDVKLIISYNDGKTNELMVNNLWGDYNFSVEMTSVPQATQEPEILKFDNGVGNYQLTFTYQGFSDIVDVVAEDKVQPPILTRISVRNFPIQVNQGYEADFTDTKLIVHYTNDSYDVHDISTLLGDDNFNVEMTSVPDGQPNNGNLIFDEGAGRYQLTFTYNEDKTVISVFADGESQPEPPEDKIDHIEVEGLPLNVNTGDNVNFDDAKIIVYYTDGHNEQFMVNDIWGEAFSVKMTSTPDGIVTSDEMLIYDNGAGVYELTFTYNGHSKTVNVTANDIF